LRVEELITALETTGLFLFGLCLAFLVVIPPLALLRVGSEGRKQNTRQIKIYEQMTCKNQAKQNDTECISPREEKHQSQIPCSNGS
jgi:hypothetical protein